MALVQLVALVTAGTLSADILVRMRPIDTSILYLRKFHAEPRQPFPLHPFDENSGLPSDSDRRTQNFRFAEMIEGAGLLGLRILALRDARTPGSGHVVFYLLPVYGALMLLAPPVVVYFAVAAAAIKIALEFGVGVQDWDFVAAVALFALVLLIAASSTVRQWVRGSMEKHAEWVRGVLVRGRAPKALPDLERVIEKSRSVGPIAVRSSDANWVSFVGHLIDSVDVVLFDVRWSSSNCEVELELIKERRAQDRVIWLVRDETCITQHEGCYQIEGVTFSGNPYVLSAPLRVSGGAWWHPVRAAQVEFLAMLYGRADSVGGARTDG